MPISLNRESTKEQLREQALELGIPLVRFCSVRELSKNPEAAKRLALTSSEMRTLVVLGTRSPTGIQWARHRGTQQFWGGRLLKRMDEACQKLVDLIEQTADRAMVLSSLAIDFDRDDGTDLCPAGQGSWLLRYAAVCSGMGTWGLNQMLLTPEYGPRVFLGGVLVAQEWEPDSPLETELCLGLEECGRCAALCPEDAIPRQAPVGAPLAQIRGLNARACARSSQPYGVQTFLAHLEQVIGKRDGDAGSLWEAIKERTTGELWQVMVMMKEGAFTGCQECVQACPVGSDAAHIQRSPHRQRDLPEGVRRSVINGLVQIEHTPARAGHMASVTARR